MVSRAESAGERLALLKLALEAAISSISGEDEELSEHLRETIRLVEDRLQIVGLSRFRPSEPKSEFNLDSLRLVQVPLSIRPGSIPGASAPRKPPSVVEGTRTQVGTAPKIDQVVYILENLGVSAKEIAAYSSTTGKKDSKSADYLLLVIEQLEIEILVCNELGHSTFVCNGLRGPEFWNSHDKQELLNMVGIYSVLYRNAEQFDRRISEIIAHLSQVGRGGSDGVVIDRPYDYDLELVKSSIAEHWHAENEMPKQNSGIVLYGAYANGKTTWKAISAGLRKRSISIGEAKSERPTPTFGDLTRTVAEELQIYDAYVFRDLPLSSPGIKETLRQYYLATGSWPTLSTGIVNVGPYKNKVTWDTIGNSLRQGRRGLEAGQSLAELRDQVRKEMDDNGFAS